MGSDALDGFRDMDDEEVDGDLFQKEDHSVDDFDEAEQDNDVVADRSTQNDNDKQPKKIRVLPLYSMLSADEQAKVFASVPEDTRLIVVATNIAESEIISYLVLAFFDIIHNDSASIFSCSIYHNSWNIIRRG